MGGKKKSKGKKGKKGKKGGKGIVDDATVEEKNHILQAELEALEQRLILTVQQGNAAKGREQEAAYRQLQLREAHEAMKKSKDAIIADMTRQYKSTDSELCEFETILKQRSEENESTIEDLKKQKNNIVAQKDAIQTTKQAEITELNNYIDQMHNNFGVMLKKTLEKMKDRIARANQAWEEEQDQNLISKFKEIINDSGQAQA